MSYFNFSADGKTIEGETRGKKIILTIGKKDAKPIEISEDKARYISVALKSLADELLKDRVRGKSPENKHLKITGKYIGLVHHVVCSATTNEFNDAKASHCFDVFIDSVPTHRDNVFDFGALVFPPQWSRGCYRYDGLLPALATGHTSASPDWITHKSANSAISAAARVTKFYLDLYGDELDLSCEYTKQPLFRLAGS